jgi:hypothetical protein
MSTGPAHVLVFDGFADWEPAHVLVERLVTEVQ